MAVAHSAASESHTGTTGSTNQTSFSWTHVQSGTPQGVLVFVHTISASNFITSVTYGGIALTRIDGAVAIDAVTEPGRTDLFFLGSGLGTGNQTITVTRTNNATIMYASAATVTAAADVNVTGIQIEENNQALAPVAVDDGTPGANSVRYAAAYYGGASPAPAGTGSTLLTSIDLGAFGNSMVRETTAGQGARNVGFTAASDDVAVVYVAVRELFNRTETPIVGDFRLTERNAYRWSEDYTQSTWTKTNITVTANSITAPNGQNTASLLLETASGGNHTLLAFTTNKRDKIYTISGYFKAYVGTNTRRVRLQLGNSLEWETSFNLTADLVAGTVTGTSGAPLASGIVSVGDGWHRLYVTARYTAADSGINALSSNVYLISGTITINYTGDTNSGVYVWGMQYEEGELSDYDPSHSIPTGGRLATDLIVGWRLAGENGSFALTGLSATFIEFQPATLSAEAGAFAFIGQSAGTRHNVRIAGGTGAFSFTGNPATLAKASNKAITADLGAFTFDGNDATLRQGYALAGNRGVFTFTGNPATLADTDKLTASAGAFALTGNAATLAKAAAPKIITADTGTFALTGGAPSISVSHHLDAATGSFSLTGNPAGLADTDRLAAETGVFTLTGNTATVRRGFALAAEAGTFATAGQPAALRHNPQILGATGTFALSGQPATLRQNYRLTAETGTFTTAGQPATLRHNPKTEAARGSFALTGGAPALLRGRYLSGGAGTFIETGQQATFRRTWAITAAAGAFTFTGNAAALTEIGAYEIDAAAGSFTLNGQLAQLAQSQTLPADTGTFALTGQQAAFAKQSSSQLSASVGAFLLAGQPASLLYGQSVAAESGAFNLTGNSAALTEIGAFELVADASQFVFTGLGAALAKSGATRRRNVLIF